MRFARRRRYPSYEVTPRGLAGALRTQRRQREKHPLLATLIAEGQPSINQVMRDRAFGQADWEARTRQERADQWKRARSELYAISANQRSIILEYWNTHRWLPGNPERLSGILYDFRQGRLTLDQMMQRMAEHRELTRRFGFQGHRVFA